MGRYTEKLELIDISKLIPYANNARTHSDEQIKKIQASLREFGFVNPVLIDKNYGIIAGHGRVEAAKREGIEKVPCVWVDHLTEAQKKAYILADNRLAEDAGWDMELLSIELEELKELDFDIGLTGFGADELSDIFGEEELEAVEDDYEVELPEEPKTKLGDIYQLGRHRLMCGDSTDKATVEKLMNGVKADMVFTDPPYRMEAQGGSNQWVGRQAAKLGESIKELCDFDPTEFLNRLKELFENNMNAYVFCNKDLVPDYLNWGIENNYSFNILFWKKPNALPLGGQHRPDTEYLLFFRKNAIWNNGLENVSYSKCLEFSRDHSTDHPTMKPLGLIGNELKISSNENSLIVDLFGGSGSTMMACEQLNRTCYMMELDPKYCDVIIDRWEALTGKKAIKL
jgi:DNA modification methylase